MGVAGYDRSAPAMCAKASLKDRKFADAKQAELEAILHGADSEAEAPVYQIVKDKR